MGASSTFAGRSAIGSTDGVPANHPDPGGDPAFLFWSWIKNGVGFETEAKGDTRKVKGEGRKEWGGNGVGVARSWVGVSQQDGKRNLEPDRG